MKSVIKKDFKKTVFGLISCTFLILFLISLGYLEKRYDILIFSSLTVLIPFINIIDKDNNSGWDAFSLSLPITRKDIVRSKYTLALCISFYIGLILILLGFAGSMAFDTEPSAIIAVALTAYLTAVISLSISLPIAIGIGIKSATPMFFMLYVLIYLSLTVQAKILNPEAVPYQNYPSALYVSVFIVSLVLLFISYLITCHLFEKRDL